MTRRTGFLLCVALLAANGIAFAAPVPPPRERGLMRLNNDLEKVGLTPEQKGKIQAIFEAGKKEQEKYEDRLRSAFKELRAMLDKDMPDESTVLHQADRIGELRTAKHKAKLRTILQVKAQLTPEQRGKLRETHRAAGGGTREKPPATPAAD